MFKLFPPPKKVKLLYKKTTKDNYKINHFLKLLEYKFPTNYLKSK